MTIVWVVYSVNMCSFSVKGVYSAKMLFLNWGQATPTKQDLDTF